MKRPCRYCGIDIDTGNTTYSADVVHTACLENHNAWVLYKQEAKAFAEKRAEKFLQDAAR